MIIILKGRRKRRKRTKSSLYKKEEKTLFTQRGIINLLRQKEGEESCQVWKGGKRGGIYKSLSEKEKRNFITWKGDENGFRRREHRRACKETKKKGFLRDDKWGLGLLRKAKKKKARGGSSREDKERRVSLRREKKRICELASEEKKTLESFRSCRHPWEKEPRKGGCMLLPKLVDRNRMMGKRGQKWREEERGGRQSERKNRLPIV